MNAATPPDLAEATLRRLEQVVERLDALTLATDFAALGPERILEFPYRDRMVRIHLPFAAQDAIQRTILRNRSFYETPELERVRPMIPPGSLVVDAGANIGNHTLYFAMICGAAAVHAIEPMRLNHAILQRNVALNGLDGIVTCHNLALGAAPGRADLAHFNPRNLGASEVALDEGEGAYAVSTLDALMPPGTQVLKVDVEGAFIAAMAGGRAAIARDRPLIWLELRRYDHVGINEFPEGAALMQGLGYRHAAQLGPNDHVFLPEARAAG